MSSFTTTVNNVKLPGRLGNPDAFMGNDDRVHPGILNTFAPYTLHNRPVGLIGGKASLEDIHTYCDAAEAGYAGAFEAMLGSLPPIKGVNNRTEVIKGVDGNDINLYISTPVNHGPTSDPVPLLFHTHGGGMVICTAQDPIYLRWRDHLAKRGCVVVGVEFRNGSGKLGRHPFPAGLNDCMSGLQWCHDNRSNLNVSKIVITGESGGGNLSIACSLKAKQDGKSDQIQGCYALCPYIYGGKS